MVVPIFNPIDLIDVSSGIDRWRRLRGRIGQGYLVDDAATLKAQTNLPLIGVGGIKTGDFIDSMVISKKTTQVTWSKFNEPC